MLRLFYTNDNMNSIPKQLSEFTMEPNQARSVLNFLLTMDHYNQDDRNTGCIDTYFI